MSGAPDEAWGWDRMRDDGHAIASGRQTRASTREALVTGSMPDAPTWTESGEDTGGRSFPRKPHPPKPDCAPARHKVSTRRSEAPHWCHLTQGATRRPRNAKPDKTATPNLKPKKRPATAGHQKQEMDGRSGPPLMRRNPLDWALLRPVVSAQDRR